MHRGRVVACLCYCESPDWKEVEIEKYNFRLWMEIAEGARWSGLWCASTRGPRVGHISHRAWIRPADVPISTWGIDQ